MIAIYISIIMFLIILIIYKIHRTFVRYIYLNKYKTYNDLLVHFLETSFDIIYKDQVAAYSFEGLKPSEFELETIQRNFVKLSLEIMGPNVNKILTGFYGNQKTLITNIVMYINQRLDRDELVDFVSRKQQSSEDSQIVGESGESS